MPPRNPERPLSTTFPEARQWLRRAFAGGAPAAAPALAGTATQWLERSDCGVLACDANGRIVAASEVAGRLLGAPPSALAGRRLSDWSPEPVAVQRPGLLAPGQREVKLVRADGRPFRAALTVGDVLERGPVRHVVVLRELPGAPGPAAASPVPVPEQRDPLTGLPDRAAFRDRLTRAMLLARDSGVALALMFLDLDDFKRVNDSLGHAAGDALLRHVARTLETGLARATRSEHVSVARIGGDEFTVIVPDIRSAEDAALVAQHILDSLEQPFRFGDTELQVSASIGISLHARGDEDLDTLLRHTDLAMYRSKLLGRGTYSFFSDEMAAEAAARVRMESDLRRALERGEFRLQYQPKARLADGHITGVEALLRWHCPGRGLVPPDRFIPVLEDSRLILPVGAWVLRQACADLAAWDSDGLPPLRMSVNLSPRQFAQPFLTRFVGETLQEHGLPAGRLELELTESLLLEQRASTVSALGELARMGVQVAMDDFGTGHSSLSRLKRLDIDTLKIDRSFVAELPHDAEDLAITSAIIAMGRTLNMKVVAEGVETEAQAECLARLGCDEVQGYLLSRPMSSAQLVDWMRERQRASTSRRPAYSDSGPVTLMTLDTLDDD